LWPQVIPATIPVVKFTTAWGPPVDVTHLGHFHDGPRSGNLLLEFVGSNPSCRPVILILKQLLKEHQLTDPMTGGIGTFVLYVLVAAYMTHEHKADAGPAQLLLGFLDLFIHTDWRGTRVSWAGGFAPRRKDDDAVVDLWVENPCRPGANMTQHVYRISQIVQVLGDFRRALESTPLAELLHVAACPISTTIPVFRAHRLSKRGRGRPHSSDPLERSAPQQP
jgi:hypothetical protein